LTRLNPYSMTPQEFNLLPKDQQKALFQEQGDT
jgi:hypothetical protein